MAVTAAGNLQELTGARQGEDAAKGRSVGFDDEEASVGRRERTRGLEEENKITS